MNDNEKRTIKGIGIISVVVAITVAVLLMLVSIFSKI